MSKRYNLMLFTYCLLQLQDVGALPVDNKKNTLIDMKQSLIKLTLPSSDVEKDKTIQMIKYDKEIYNLAYKIYLQNNNIQNAYFIALSAVQQNPNNTLWRTRLAQVAIWNHNPLIASEQYIYLAKHHNDRHALQAGLQLAKSMHDDESLTQLIPLIVNNGHHPLEFWQTYIDTLLRIGNIDQAIEVLNNNNAKFPHSFYLLSMAKIYKLVGNPTKQLYFLTQYTAKLPITADIALQQAEIYLAQNKFDNAYHVLTSAHQIANDNNYPFWQAYAVVSSLTNHDEQELYAYQKLYLQKKPELYVYSRLIDLTAPIDRKLAYQYAKKAKKAYPNNLSIAINTFLLNNQNDAWEDFPELEASTPRAIFQRLNYDVSLAEANANYLQHIGLHDRAVEKYVEAIRYLPINNYLKADFLFFLIQTRDLPRLTNALSLWEKTLASNPSLWGTYAEGYIATNNPNKAKLMIQMYYDTFNINKKDPYWLIVLKDILENSYLPEQSWAITHYTWPIYLDLLTKQKQPLDYNQLLNFVKLSMQETPGDLTGRALVLLQKTKNVDTETLMMTWALLHNNYELADAIYWNYQPISQSLPGWVQLSIAMHHNDQSFIKDLLTSSTYISSYRDQIQAAQDIDAISSAQTVAFRELAKHQNDDAELYDNYFKPVMLKTAQRAYVSQEYYQYAAVEGPRNNTSYTYFLTPSISLTPYNSLWFSNRKAPSSNNRNLSGNTAVSNSTIVNVPSRDERVGIKGNIIQRRGDLSFELGERSDLNSFFTGKIQRSYQWYQDLNTLLAFNYHQPSEDSLGLLVGGMKNYINLGTTYRLSAQNTLFGDYNQNFFYTQQGQHVANSSQTTLRFEHKWRQSYPDWTISVYGTDVAYFNKTQTLYGNILNLIPTGVSPSVNFLIPGDFTEYGITGSFGENFIDDYTHAWRPFASITLSNSSSVGFGQVYNMGAAGHIFGRDHLSLYYEQGTNQGQGIQLSRLIKASYLLYF